MIALDHACIPARACGWLVLSRSGVFPVDDDFFSTRALFRLAAWCDRQGEFMEYGGTISGE